MGIIKLEVQDTFFSQHNDNEKLIKFFLNGFDVTYACEKHISNTTIFAYILKPENFMTESFGFDREMLLVYSPFDRMEPRSIQAINELTRQYPFSGRIDTLNFFFMSDDPGVEEWLKSSANSETVKIIVPFSTDEIRSSQDNPWYMRNKLRRYFFGLDLFNFILPLNDDSYFFGRQQIVARYIDSIKRGENRGVFGLRKTGKTSLLYKIERIVTEQKLGEVIFYDCKSPQYRTLHYTEFLYEIYSDICMRIGVAAEPELGRSLLIKNLLKVVSKASIQAKKLILIFDEIEYISFIAPLDAHWKTEFVDFWQTIWAIQSQHRNLTFIISGVNASVTEIDSIPISGRKFRIHFLQLFNLNILEA